LTGIGLFVMLVAYLYHSINNLLEINREALVDFVVGFFNRFFLQA